MRLIKILSTLTLLVCLSQCSPKEASYQIENIPICYKDYELHLGMDFDTLKAKFPDLVINQKGPNKATNQIFDFYSLSEPTIKVSRYTQMTPTIYASLSKDQELLGLSIQYLCSGSGQLDHLDLIVDYVRTKLYTCMSKNFIQNGLKEETSTDNYSSLIQLDTSQANFWNFIYEIKLKPH
mgnify:CR=1 FL=1